MIGRWPSLSQLNRGPVQAVHRQFVDAEQPKITSSVNIHVAAHWLAFGPEVNLSADYILENSVGAI